MDRGSAPPKSLSEKSAKIRLFQGSNESRIDPTSELL